MGTEPRTQLRFAFNGTNIAKSLTGNVCARFGLSFSFYNGLRATQNKSVSGTETSCHRRNDTNRAERCGRPNVTSIDLNTRNGDLLVHSSLNDLCRYLLAEPRFELRQRQQTLLLFLGAASVLCNG